MIAFPSPEPGPATGPLPFGANQRETLWRYRQAVWSPSLLAVAEDDRRDQVGRPAQQLPAALTAVSVSRRSAPGGG